MEKGSKSMKKALLNWRYYAMAAIGIITAIGLFSEPSEDLDMSYWFAVLLATKAIGFGAGFALFRLVSYWEKQNLIPELSKLIMEE